MKHIVENFEENIYGSALWNFYFDGMKVGVLDIETTGLNSSRNKFVLGCIYDVKDKKLHQILAECRQEEAEALYEYLKIVNKFDVILTYNGRNFDIPFIQKRAEAYTKKINDILNYASAYDMPYNLDLYQVLNRYSPIKKLVPNMKQKTIENYMGFWMDRTDEISGAESVELYNYYESTGDKESEKKILLHNNDDVRQLTKLSKAVIKSDFHKAMHMIGFPVKNLTINKIKIGKEYLEVSGIQRRKYSEGTSFIDYRCYMWGDYGVEANFDKKSAAFNMSIPLIKQSEIIALDLRAANLNEEIFSIYPSSGSGFLIIEDAKGIKYMELNHFIKVLLEKFIDQELHM